MTLALRSAARRLRLLAALVGVAWLTAFAPPAGAHVTVLVVLHHPGSGGAR
ncbi:hypothetical protein [Streptomyces noursei]|uniref:hypothetical protein n=1 Tax=Streptomyces noursei TaxID=1971 RepID=UPI0019659D1B|nr:hypothetical protein [Streptomyces noursei]QRX92039.1 hypothetical protein JNO44_15290 [Streptomyces noursei]